MRIPLEFSCCVCGKQTVDLEGEVCTYDCDENQGKEAKGVCNECLERNNKFKVKTTFECLML